MLTLRAKPGTAHRDRRGIIQIVPREPVITALWRSLLYLGGATLKTYRIWDVDHSFGAKKLTAGVGHLIGICGQSRPYPHTYSLALWTDVPDQARPDASMAAARFWKMV